MINLYKKSVNSFLSLKDTISRKPSPNNSKAQQPTEEHGLGLGLISSHNNNLTQFKSPNVLQSCSLLIKPVSAPRKDSVGSGRVGFIDSVGSGDVDGLMSCTESLGFESSDERLVSEDLMRLDRDNGGGGGGCRVRTRRRTVVERRFPPPLTTLNQHGHPNFYLRPVRKDGRLELTEVRIERTEILRACRGDGRLRLHLIKDETTPMIEEEDEEEQPQVVEGIIVKEEKMEFRRCLEVVNQKRRRDHHRGNHHHHLDVWRQHCVTSS